MKKRLLSLLLAVSMSLTTLCVPASAQGAVKKFGTLIIYFSANNHTDNIV